ncbi:CinA family protein [Cryptosporangium sp. NPDC051539]|uniref:CinA family protein n=1 Tax=Cryptosporangium sp. NPDC051539 TaxID=3363962 RepID=UPI003791CC6E
MTHAPVPPTEPTAAGVLAALRARGETLATAESLTGGLLAAHLVDVPGASRVFRGGLVPYATDLKAALVGVDPDLLDRLGPVAAEVAAALAAGTAQRCGADWGIGTTGVAGPDPQDGKPAGTVFVGVAGPAGPPAVRALHLAGDRPAIRAATVSAALALLAERLDGKP